MTINLEGIERETVEIRVRLGRDGFVRLAHDSVPCSSVWLTKQPDGSFALGITTPGRPESLGFTARKVEHDDRAERFGDNPAIDTRHLLP